MKGYAARRDGSAIYVTKDKQIDEMLENGCDIVRVEDDDSVTVIATPKDGFLEERPILDARTETMTNPYAEALSLLYEEK